MKSHLINEQLAGAERVLRQEPEPLPSPWEVVTGIPHKNKWNPEPLTQEPVQAIASKKQHDSKKLEVALTASVAPGAQKLPFVRLLPSLLFAGTVRPLDNVGKQWYMANMKVSNIQKYVHHVIEKHNGEAVLLGDFQWLKFPADGGQGVDDGLSIFHPDFWHPQYMKVKETREWLRSRRSRYKKAPPGHL